MDFKVWQLDKELNTSRLAQIYFFYGENEFLQNEYIEKITKLFLSEKKSKRNYIYLEGKNLAFEDFKYNVLSRNLFSQKQMIFVNEIDNTKNEERKKIIEFITTKKSISEKIIIFSSLKLINKRSYQKLIDESYTTCFWPLFEKDVPSWIVKHCKEKYNSEIDDKSANLLFKKIGNNLSLLSSELEKLSIIDPNSNKIKYDDVKNYVNLIKSYSVFDLTKALGNRQSQAAIFVYNQLLKDNEPFILILNTIISYFSKLYKAKLMQKNLFPFDDISKSLGINKKYTEEYLNTAQNFSFKELLTSLENLNKIDFKLKTGQNSYHINLTNLIYSIANTNNR